MEADPTFHFYCNNDGRDGGRSEHTLRKSQVTLDRLVMIFKVNFFIYEYRVRNKASQFANWEPFFGKLQIEINILLENCKSTFFDD